MKVSKKVSAASLVMALTYGTLGAASAQAPVAGDTGSVRDGAALTLARQGCSGKCNGKCSSAVEKA